ncbi:uncharacterized protein LOC110440778 isoform X2 [Mizuhopecten yessoensis]|nr:uncharacterized protein LOC110440778 isoform X2 [Mizuhopecten yessoensis]
MTSLELWSSVASTLCMCVNNPRNDENQGRCGLELGFMFSLIQHCDNPSVLRPLLSLVGFSVASNARNQDQVRQCGGLLVLIARLKVALDLALCQNSETDSRTEHINLAVTIARTIDSCILDNAENAEDLGKGDAIPSLLELLLLGSLRQEDKLQVVLTLGHMLELSCENRIKIDAVTGLPDLVKLLTDSEDEEFSKAVKYLLQMCVAKNEKNFLESKEEDLDAARRENGKKMLLKIDEISERLKVIEKEAEEKSLALQQTGQGKEPVKERGCGILSATPYKNNLLFQLQQEREERKRMESIAFRMHVPSPHVQQYGLEPRPCLSEENFPVHRGTFIESDRQRLHHQSLCCSTPDSSCHRKGFGQNPNMYCVNNCPEYTCGNQDVDCHSSAGHGSHFIGPDGTARLCMPNHQTTQDNSGKITSVQDTNAAYEPKHHHVDLKLNMPCSTTQVKAFSQDLTPLKKCILDHRGDRNSDCQCPERYGNELCSTLNIDTVEFNHENKGPKTVRGIDQVTDVTTDNSRCESAGRNTLGKELASSNTYLNQGLKGLERIDKGKVSEDLTINQMMVTSTSATDIPKMSTSSDQFTDHGMLRNSTSTPKNSKTTSLIRNSTDIHSQYQKTRTSVSSNVSTDRCSLNNSSTSNEHNSSVKKSCNLTKRDDVFVKPKPPTVAGCYQTPVRRPSNTRMTRSLGSKDRPNMSVKLGVSLHSKSTIADSYPDSDCSSVLDTNSEFDLDLVKTAKKNRLNQTVIQRNSFSQNICYSVTPIKRKSLPIKELQRENDRTRIREDRPNVGSTPCSVKSIDRMTDHFHDENYCENYSDTFSSVEDDDSDIENLENSREENLVCLDNQKLSAELGASKCPGCTIWLSSPSNKKRMVMNSRTYNLLLETSLYTCENHKAIRDSERKFIQQTRKNSSSLYKNRRLLPSISSCHKEDLQYTKKTMSVYDFMSSESDRDDRVTPPHSSTSCKYNLATLRNMVSRRNRIPYAQEEVDNIIKGVAQLGTRWNQILVTFKFHPTRTATDLRDKYKRLVTSQTDIQEETISSVSNKNRKKRGSKLFSMCEERRLIRGVKKYGYNWKSILNSYSFSKGRNSQDLRNRWRSMHKKVTHV